MLNIVQEMAEMGDEVAPTGLFSPLFLSSKCLVPLSMRGHLWWPTFTFGLCCEMKANCSTTWAGKCPNPEDPVVVLDTQSLPWLTKMRLPAWEDVRDYSLTIRQGLSWMCLQFREYAATTGTLNSLRKCGRDMGDIFLILSQPHRHSNIRDVKVGNVVSIRMLSRKCVPWR